jgi:colanic acid biosynthesis glycosyl transferase WcaI
LFSSGASCGKNSLIELRSPVISLWFVNRYFAPDESATSQLLTDLTNELGNHQAVNVICSRQSLLGGNRDLPVQETIGKTQVFRIWSTAFGRDNLVGRALDSLSFLFACGWALFRKVRSGDTVILMTDPPLLQLLNTGIVQLKGGRVINWLHDLYPELAFRLGKIPHLLNTWLSLWRDRALRAAEMNVAVSDSMANYLRQRGISQVAVISNWAEEEAITPLDHDASSLRPSPCVRGD